MQLGMIGLGRMGAGMVRRLLRDGHDCVVHDTDPARVAALAAAGARGAASIGELVGSLAAPRALWIMVPAARVEEVLADLAGLLASGDIVVDGGNSHFLDDRRRAERLGAEGIAFIDVGTSGGVWGLERGYCLMIGGESRDVERMEPVFRSLAPGMGAAPATAQRAGRGGSAEQGYLHCGAAGAGHYVKMVHNGIEYGMMAALAEGFQLMHAAAEGDRAGRYAYQLDVADIAELWRRGSVIGSWLLDLSAAALARDADLADYTGRVEDSGEGRWTVQAAVDQSVPAHVLTAALYERFSSRQRADYAQRLLSAMRHAFGGHGEEGR